MFQSRKESGLSTHSGNFAADPVNKAAAVGFKEGSGQECVVGSEKMLDYENDGCVRYIPISCIVRPCEEKIISKKLYSLMQIMKVSARW